MPGFGLIEGAGGFEGGYGMVAEGVEFVEEFPGGLLLVFIEVEYGGAVLVAGIGALSVELGRVVDFEEAAQYGFVADLFGIEADEYGFGVAGIASAHVFIGGAVGVSAGIAGAHVHHAGQFAHGVFHAPEAAARKHGHAGSAHLGVECEAQLFLFAACGGKAHGQRIHAVARIFFREAFALEHVPEVRAAVVALNLHPVAVGIGQAAHHVGEGVVEGGPAAAGVEFIRRAVQRHAALAAEVGSGGGVLFVFAGPRGFRGLAENDLRFHGRQGRHGGVAAGHNAETVVDHGVFLP